MAENKNIVWLGGLALAAGLGVAVGGAASASADTGTAGPAGSSKADHAQSAKTGHTNRVKASDAKGTAAKSAVAAGPRKQPRVTVAPLAAASVPASVRTTAAPAPAAAAPTTPNIAAASATVTSDVSAITRASAVTNPIQQLFNAVANLIQRILAIPQAIITQISKLFGGSGSGQGSGDYKVNGTVELKAGSGVMPPPVTVGSNGSIYALSLTYNAGGTTTGAELQVYAPGAGSNYTTVALDPSQFAYSKNTAATYNLVAGVGGDTNIYISGYTGSDRTVIVVSNTGVVKTIPLGATSDVALVATTTGVFAASTTLDGGVYKPALWTINPGAGTAAKAILTDFVVSTSLAYRDGPALAAGPSGTVYLIGYKTNSTQAVTTVGAGGAVGTPVVIGGNSTFYLNGTRFVADAGHVYTPSSVINASTGGVSAIALGLGSSGRTTHLAIGSDGLLYINTYDSTTDGPSNGAVRVYNPATGKTVATVKLGGYVSTVATANGQIYALRSDTSTGKYYVDVIGKTS